MSQQPKPFQDQPDTSRVLRFRIVHIAYIVTLLASSLATFGPLGLLLGIPACFFWAWVFTSRDRPKVFLRACVMVLIGFCFLSLLMLPVSRRAREAARRMSCSNNLKQIALALANYETLYGSYPPAYIADKNGKPMHSWRVLLLPFLEQQPLYDKYNFDEPWNGPNNSKLINSMPYIYSCPSAAGPHAGRNVYTSYLAVVGPNTMWPGASARKLSEITDGTDNTLLMIGLDNQAITWLEPRDLEFAEILPELASADWKHAGNHKNEDFFYQSSSGRNVAFVDGNVTFVQSGLGQEWWSVLLEVNDGISQDGEDVEGRDVMERPKIGNWVRLSIFILLALLPLPWVWLNPGSARWKSHFPAGRRV